MTMGAPLLLSTSFKKCFVETLALVQNPSLLKLFSKTKIKFKSLLAKTEDDKDIRCIEFYIDLSLPLRLR